jgi:hypothetical protein
MIDPKVRFSIKTQNADYEHKKKHLEGFPCTDKTSEEVIPKLHRS